MKHKLIVIGYTGISICYLDVDIEEAIRRYCIHDMITRAEFDNTSVPIESFGFDDEFGTYDAWSL
jgi:hypothetical protein